MSSTAWTDCLPSASTHKQYERGQIKQLGGLPPIRMVPEPRDAEGEEKATLTIKVGNGKATYEKFAGGNCEDAVRHIMKFWQVEKKLGHRDTIASAKSLLKDDQEKLADDDVAIACAAKIADGSKPLVDGESQPTVLTTPQRKAIDDSIKNYKDLGKTTLAELWQLWEDFLTEPLTATWLSIVEHETEGDIYVDKRGNHETGPRGRSFNSFYACL